MVNEARFDEAGVVPVPGVRFARMLTAAPPAWAPCVTRRQFWMMLPACMVRAAPWAFTRNAPAVPELYQLRTVVPDPSVTWEFVPVASTTR